MTNFRVFFKIVQKNIWLIVMYTTILLVMSITNIVSGNTVSNFTASKPEVVIYDHDGSIISQGLVNYLEEHATILDIPEEGDKLSDALYHDKVDYAIFIDSGFGAEIQEGRTPEVTVKSIGTYDSYLAETLLGRFIKVVSSFKHNQEDVIVENTVQILKNETKTELNTKLDTEGLSHAAMYYSFLNFSILAGLVFAISLATVGFRNRMIKKRIAVSSTSYKKINFDVLTCSLIIAVIIWALYNIIGIFLVGADVMFSLNGLLMIVNSLILTIFATAFALLLSNLVQKSGALNAIINVVSIGSSFLCGVFVPIEWMPEFATNIAKILPSYYYIENNILISKLEVLDWEHLQPIVTNAVILLAVTALNAIANNIVTRYKR